jgi:hypothetical protein
MEPVTGKITLLDNDAHMEPLACVTAAASIVYIPEMAVSVTVMEMHACFLLHHFALFVVIVVVVDDDDNSPTAICNIYSHNNDVPTSKISTN